MKRFGEMRRLTSGLSTALCLALALGLPSPQRSAEAQSDAGIDAFRLETEDFLHRNCVAFHAGQFGQAGHFTAAIAES
mgnify:CR=1 FL=1